MNVAELSGLFFLDTNILVYTFNATAPEKRETARRLVQFALSSQRGVISTQIVQEFLNVGLRKFVHPLTISEGREYLKTVLMPLCQHYPTISFYDQALLLQEETGFSFYDTLVVAAAVETECTMLLSEDLQDGRTVRGVEIVNPFVAQG